MPLDNERDAKRDESRDAKYAQARRRAKMRERFGEDDDVDWSKTRQIVPARSVKSSNLIAFGVPFAVASLALLWFSLHDRDKEVKPTVPESFQSVLEETRHEKNLKDAEADDSLRFEEVAMQNDAAQNVVSALAALDSSDDDPSEPADSLPPLDPNELPDLADDLLSNEDPVLPELADDLPNEEPALPAPDDDLDLLPNDESPLPELADNLPNEEPALPAPDDDLDLLPNDSDPAPASEPVEGSKPLLVDDELDETPLPELDETPLPTDETPASDDASLVDLEPVEPVDAEPASVEPTDAVTPSLPDAGDLAEDLTDAADDLANATLDLDSGLDPALEDAAPSLADDLASPAPDVELSAEPVEPVASPDPDAALDPIAADDEANAPDTDASDFPDESDAIEETRAQVAQLEFDFAKIRERDSRDSDDVLASVDALLARARELEAAAPDAARDDVAALASRAQEFQAYLERNAAFFDRLEELDADALDLPTARAFFVPYLNGGNAEQNDDPEIAAYRSELARAGKALDALKTIEEWNAFIEENGEKLQKFHVDASLAARAVQFVETTSKKPGAPQDLAVMAKRAPEWRFETARNTGAYRKIILMLEKEISQTYWTYSPARNKFYYLSAAPREGLNPYVSTPRGDLQQTNIPADAPELSSKESPQKEELTALMKMAWPLTDEMRERDPAQWYKDWSAFLEELRSTDKIDPIIQYSFFRDVARRLSESDYYFARHLASLLNVLNAPQLEKKSQLDRFSTDSPQTIALRDVAISRMNFLPSGSLEVKKTTEELDAQTERFAYVYQPVGWLDRNFAGAEVCRRSATAPEVDVTGSLYVYVAADGESEARWIQVGRAENGLLRLDVATDAIPRGSLILCKTPVNSAPAVAKRDALESVLKR